MLKECKLVFETAESYLDHLKELHRVPTIYRYECTKSGCCQIFTTFHPFRKHIIGHSEYRVGNIQHDTTYTNDNTIIVDDKLECTNEEPPHSSAKRQKLEEGSTSYEPGRDNTEKHAEVDRAVIMFTLSLHNKNNITRKDVYDIQNEASVIFKELADLLGELDVKLENAEDEFSFKSCIERMKNVFRFISSDFNFF